VERETIALYKAVAPSTVQVAVVPQAKGDSGPAKVARVGSGFVWDEQGHIVTAAPLLSGADSVRVTLGGGTAWSADVVGVDADSGLAVLRIQAPKNRLQPIAMGTSKDLRVGQFVFAFGTPRSRAVHLSVRVLAGLDSNYKTELQDGRKQTPDALARGGRRDRPGLGGGSAGR
jgi:S1-C subfamily serine protease